MNWLTLDNRTDEFQRDVITGLSSFSKHIPSKWLYDHRGSELFEQICELDEYYVTRTETAIMQRHASQMADAVGKHCCLVELGSGNSAKTRLLLHKLEHVTAYVPLDISRDYLFAAADRLSCEFPRLNIQPHVADFTEELSLPSVDKCDRIVFYFPGSTVGNLSREHSVRLFKRMASLAGRGCGLLIGIDLIKNARVINAAYNDAKGVTAAFSKNLLTRINRELGGNFECDLFEHVARYDRARSLVDIGLQSQTAQHVVVGDCDVFFEQGEMIHTETSRKYRVNDFGRLASAAGFRLRNSWTDRRRYFAVLYLEALPRHSSLPERFS